MSDKNQDYFEKVFTIVSQIPRGKVTTYGAIAGCIGVKSGARMVGWALNKSIGHEEYDVPAHRVVNRLGQLSGRGYFPGDTMRELLEQEDVLFKEDYTVDINKHFWDPCEE